MMFQEQKDLYTSVGGIPIMVDTKGVGHVMKSSNVDASDDVVWYFGWLMPSMRTEEVEEEYYQAQKSMLPWAFGLPKREEKEVDLTKLLWEDPRTVKALGFKFKGMWQVTGSCVGAGGGNNQLTTIIADVLLRKDLEKIFLPGWLFTYGRSRYHCGMRGRGEGSLESCWLKAARQDGVVAFDHPKMPKPQITSEGFVKYTSAEEYAWSNGGGSPCVDVLEDAKKIVFPDPVLLRSIEEIDAALYMGYSVGQGSMYGFNAYVEDGECFGERGPRWSHKMTIQGRKVFDRKGVRYKMYNQWGLAHRGFAYAWVPQEDIEWILRTSGGEVVAYPGIQGIKATEIDWSNVV